MGDKAMIDPKKLYRTRDGREVRIYATDCNDVWPIHGARWDGNMWAICAWTEDGSAIRGEESPIDLIEVKPRIQREVWVNVYPEEIETLYYRTKGAADRGAVPKRIACVRLTIDCEEGHGLD